jgi:uncharacterized protein Yka (UPF0111/DUF47 family)
MSAANPNEQTIRRLLVDAGENAHAAALVVHDLVSDPDRRELAATLRLREHDGDQITHDIIHALAARSADLIEIDAGDAYRLAGAIDDIVDYADEAGDALVLYGIEAPMEQAIKLADVLMLATAEVASALTTFDDDDEAMALKLAEIHRLENEGDRLLRAGLAALFETGIDPMVVIRWKDIFERLENAIDACQTVGHLLEGAALTRRVSARPAR